MHQHRPLKELVVSNLRVVLEQRYLHVRIRNDILFVTIFETILNQPPNPSSSSSSSSLDEQPVVFEYQRQKDYLEKSLLALQAKYETEVSVEKQASVDQREQNLSLIGEITDIRLCLQHKKAQVQTLRAAMGSQKLLASNNKSTTQSPPVVSKTTPQQKSKQQNPKARDQAIMWTQEKLMQQHEYMEYMTTQIRQYEQLIQKDLQSRSAECTTTSSIIANNGIDG